MKEEVKRIMKFVLTIITYFLASFSFGIFMILLSLKILDNLSFIDSLSLNIVKLIIFCSYIVGALLGMRILSLEVKE